MATGLCSTVIFILILIPVIYYTDLDTRNTRTPCLMNLQIFRSDRNSETYLYLAADCPFEDLPEDLQATFGEPVFVMALELFPEKKLARVAARDVLKSLHERGYFLQLPPKLPLENEISNWFA